jgi:hypothetical protein
VTRPARWSRSALYFLVIICTVVAISELVTTMIDRPTTVVTVTDQAISYSEVYPIPVHGIGVWLVVTGAAIIWVLLKVALASRLPNRLRDLPASSLIDLAVLLAGPGRPALRDEWHAHLAGESGHDPVTWPKARQALGFAAAAIQLRLADAADLAWRPADAVLGSRTLSNLFVGGPVILTLFAIVHHDGRFGLVTDIQDAGELGAFLYGAIRTGRWWRGVKPPEPKARRARE